MTIGLKLQVKLQVRVTHQHASNLSRRGIVIAVVAHAAILFSKPVSRRVSQPVRRRVSQRMTPRRSRRVSQRNRQYVVLAPHLTTVVAHVRNVRSRTYPLFLLPSTVFEFNMHPIRTAPNPLAIAQVLEGVTAAGSVKKQSAGSAPSAGLLIFPGPPRVHFARVSAGPPVQDLSTATRGKIRADHHQSCVITQSSATRTQ